MGATSLIGTLSFGLVEVPVRVLPVLEPKDTSVKFKNLHKECLTPVTQPKRCTHEKCNRLVEQHELVSGYPVSKNEYLVITPEERASVATDRSPDIVIHKFIPWDGAGWFRKMRLASAACYYVVPDPDKPSRLGRYALVMEALKDNDALGLAKATFWSTKPWTCVIEADPQGLMLTKLHPLAAIREREPLPQREYKENELELATRLIEAMTAEPEMADFEHASDVELRALIDAKLAGQTYVVPEAEAKPQIDDIQEALRVSIKEAEKRKKKPRKKVKA